MNKIIGLISCILLSLSVLSCNSKNDVIKPENKFENILGDYGGVFTLTGSTNPYACWNNGPQNAQIKLSGDELFISVNTIFGDGVQGGGIKTNDIVYDAATKKWSGTGSIAQGLARFSFDESTKIVSYSFSSSSFSFDFTGEKGKDISSEYVKMEDLKKMEGKYSGPYTLKYRSNNGNLMTQTGSVENFNLSVDGKGKITVSRPNPNGGFYTFEYRYNSLKYYSNGIQTRTVCPTLTDYLDYSNEKLKLKHLDTDNNYEFNYELTKD